MGCSDRYDLDYCEFKLNEFYSWGTQKKCGKVVDSGIYCKEHTHNILPKEDAEEIIKKLKANAVQKRLRNRRDRWAV